MPNEHDGDRDTISEEPQEKADAPDVTDPVKQQFEESVDLYDVATWEARTPLDHFALRLADVLSGQRRTLLLTFALSLFLGQVVFLGLFLVQAPVLGILSVLSVVPALVLVVVVWTNDPTEREPVGLLVVTFVLAVLFASFAAVTNSVLLPGFELFGVLGVVLFYFLVVGPVEEFVKWLAIRVHAFRSSSFKTVVDGAVYGAVAGFGFATIENLVYIVYVSTTATPFGTVIEQQYAISIAVTRSFVGPGHVIFSAWAGFYLGLAKFNPEHSLPIILKGLLIAAFIHATYNTFVTVLPLTTVGFIVFVLFYHTFWFGLLYRKIGHYRELYEKTASQQTATPSTDEMTEEKT